MKKLLAGAALPFFATVALAGQPLSDKQMDTIAGRAPQAAGPALMTKHSRQLANHHAAKRKLYRRSASHDRPHR